MVSFNSLAALLLVAGANGQSLRSTSRQLSGEAIAGYATGSQVTDHNAIDLDQLVIVQQVAEGTPQSFGIAQAVYEKGAHSKSFARLTLASGLSTTLAKGTVVSGTAVNGNDVVGKAFEEAASGSTEITVQYRTSDIQATYVNCQVGANPDPNLEGCFAESGNVTISGVSYDYSYDPAKNNENGRTIQGFSTSAQSKMSTYVDFKKFFAYYGKYDYANQWILAAFGGTGTSFTNGNANFGTQTDVGKGEAIKKGTAYMAIYMYVLREFEDALDDCKDGCILCNDDPVHAWDEGVAFYTGSLEGQDGSGEGQLLYALADKRCKNFRTCGVNGNQVEGTSKLNFDIFGQFALGQQNLVQGNCEAARKQKERISELMKVPVVQGTLRYAYITGEQETSEKAEAEGAVFAAAVLPYVHDCSEKDALTIFSNMALNSGPADFEAVKEAFENNYKCMGITCADVGGIVNPGTGEYFEGAGPCKDSSNSSDDPNTVGIALGVTAGVIAVAAIGCVCFMRKREIQGKPIFSSENKEGSEVS